jgi:hypothetical protein
MATRFNGSLTNDPQYDDIKRVRREINGDHDPEPDIDETDGDKPDDPRD